MESSLQLCGYCLAKLYLSIFIRYANASTSIECANVLRGSLAVANFLVFQIHFYVLFFSSNVHNKIRAVRISSTKYILVCQSPCMDGWMRTDRRERTHIRMLYKMIVVDIGFFGTQHDIFC